MAIHVVVPVNGWSSEDDPSYLSGASSIGAELVLVGLKDGPRSIESDYDIAMAGPHIVQCVQEAEAAGAHAVVLDCMADPVLHACREVARIPVIGPAQNAFALASTLAERFSVLAPTTRDVPFIRDQWRRYGCVERAASARVVGLDVAEMLSGGSAMLERMVSASLAAIEQDGTGALVYGCTIMSDCHSGLLRALADRGYGGIPVIDPMVAAIQTAEMFVRLGLSHSAVTWPPLER